MVPKKERRIMNREQIKLIAVGAMTVNHTAFAFLMSGTVPYIVMTDIGYLTAVTMCYFLVEGDYHTRSKTAYMRRLGISAVLSQAPYMLAVGLCQLNMLFTLLLCFIVLLVMDKVRHKVLKISAAAVLFCCSCFCDWAFKAVLFTVFFNLTYRAKQSLIIPFSAAFMVQFCLSLYAYQAAFPAGQALLLSFFSSVGIIVSGYLIIRQYNGQRSEKHKTFWKWFFYLYYPLHLLLLYLLSKTILR